MSHGHTIESDYHLNDDPGPMSGVLSALVGALIFGLLAFSALTMVDAPSPDFNASIQAPPPAHG